jgi:hypothetical protein
LQNEGWDVHTQLDDPTGSPLESYPDGSEKETELNRRLQELNDSLPKRALILKTSHIGGHKYAGNVIVRVLAVTGEHGRIGADQSADLNRFTCPKALGSGMVVYPLTRSSLSCIRLFLADKYYLLCYAGALTSRGQIAKDLMIGSDCSNLPSFFFGANALCDFANLFYLHVDTLQYHT